MSIHGVDHINIRTPDLERCKRFYCGILGFEEGYRPPFDSPGAWLYSEGAPLVHLSVADGEPGADTGALDHIAFAAKGFEATRARLEQASVRFRTLQVPDNPTRQIFVTDPDGVSVELNFRDGV
jgi:catechol 2,3-dioxygenase-like lactoylglutathione lyase family enzyme